MHTYILHGCCTSTEEIIQLTHASEEILKDTGESERQQTLQWHIEENIKAAHHSPVCGEFTGDKGPVTREMYPFDDVITKYNKPHQNTNRVHNLLNILYVL